jgi:hypothetical protein
MPADTSGKVKKGAGSVEEDRFDHKIRENAGFGVGADWGDTQFPEENHSTLTPLERRGILPVQIRHFPSGFSAHFFLSPDEETEL